MSSLNRPKAMLLALSLTLLQPMVCFANSFQENIKAVQEHSSNEKIGVALPGALREPTVEPTLEPMDLPTNLAPEGVTIPNTQHSEAEPIKARAVVVDINSDTLKYDKEKDVYVATGSAHVVISEQNSDLTADKVIYDETRGLLFAEGHVIINKHGQRTEGTYAKIDLTRNSALIDDAATVIKAVRVKAKKALVDDRYIELEDGKLIISGQYLSYLMSQGAGGSSLNSSTRVTNKYVYKQQLEQQRAIFKQQAALAEESLNSRDFENPKNMSKLRIKAKEIDIVQDDDGFNKINLKWPALYYGKYRLGSLPADDFSYDSESKQFTYQGPDIGYNFNYGGYYFGPGWDFRLGKGTVRFSPLLSYGNAGYQTGRKAADEDSKKNMPGIGGILHYRDEDTILDVAYNARVGYPVIFGQRRLFSNNTHLQVSLHDFYQNGLLGYTERPEYIAQITDYRALGQYKNLQFSSFESIGYAHDNFHPTNKAKFFVSPASATPQSAGRVQLQGQVQTAKPFLHVGNFFSMGARGQVLLSGYSTGDLLGIVRAGPLMNFNVKNRFTTSIAYYLSTLRGQTPFVFDAYYGGRQNMNITNAFKVNDYVTIGLYNNLNLLKDNSQKALVVGNSIYMMVGPKDVKLNLAFDLINKRTSFGINFYPGSGNTPIEYDKMKIFQPQHFSGQPVP